LPRAGSNFVQRRVDWGRSTPTLAPHRKDREIFMAENPQAPSVRPRPLSPFLSIYRWPVTMATSITHRATGIALSAGMIFLAWWLLGLASGPDMYQPLIQLAGTPIGLIVLFGFLWSLCYHWLNGIRHLAWDIGYGFEMSTANWSGVVVSALSVLLAIGIFIVGYEIARGAVRL
jgi:succinate dehydrogenase / fumarate reductase cytochrome b subunit